MVGSNEHLVQILNKGGVNMSESERLEQLLLIQDNSRAENKISDFMDQLANKEKPQYNYLVINEGEMTIDNLLSIIDKLEDKLDNLTDEYNEMLDDCYYALDDALDALPNYELL